MKSCLPIFACLLLAAPAAAQDPPATDILVLDMPAPHAEPHAVRAVNMTNRDGYDNQPHFTPDGTAILYTSIRDGQADVYRLELASTLTRPLATTPESEYSPTPIPGSGDVSVVRVEADGTQRLWRLPEGGGPPTLLLEDVAPVGYHAWGDAHTLLLFVLGEPPTLQRVDLRTGRADTIATNIGRSLQRVPGAAAVSFVDRSNADAWQVKRFDLATGAVTDVAPTLSGREDHAWTPDGRPLMGNGSALLSWDPAEARWVKLADFSQAGFTNITRIAVSPDGRRLALVVDRPQ